MVPEASVEETVVVATPFVAPTVPVGVTVAKLGVTLVSVIALVPLATTFPFASFRLTEAVATPPAVPPFATIVVGVAEQPREAAGPYTVTAAVAVAPFTEAVTVHG